MMLKNMGQVPTIPFLSTSVCGHIRLLGTAGVSVKWHYVASVIDTESKVTELYA